MSANEQSGAVAGQRRQPGGGIDGFFKISERGSSVGREVRGGVVTFLTMAYIIVLNPIILLGGVDVNDAQLAGGDFAAISAATALAAGVLTILMGLVANFPLALATGLGLNAFVTFSIASQMTWADAMGLIVIEGLIILVLVLTGFREAVFRAVPAQLKIAISVGIGLFLTIIGLVDAGFVRRIPDANLSIVPVQLGQDGQLVGWPVAIFCLGLIVLFALHARKVKGAILITIVAMTVVAIIVEKVAEIGPMFGAATGYNPGGWGLNVPALPDDVIGTPDLQLLGEFNLLGSWENAGIVVSALFVFTLLLADFFDTMGTMTAIGTEAGLLDEEGMPPNTNRILIVDSIAAAAGGAASVSSNTSYIESASGVAEGARTGLASIVTGLLFLLAMFFAPVVNIIPSEAAVPALVLVGFLMMQQVSGIDWDDLEIAIPAFLTIVLMPFTYSITVGIGAGFLAFVILKVVRGKLAEVHVLMWVIAALFVGYFAIHPLTAWLT